MGGAWSSSCPVPHDSFLMWTDMFHPILLLTELFGVCEHHSIQQFGEICCATSCSIIEYNLLGAKKVMITDLCSAKWF